AAQERHLTGELVAGGGAVQRRQARSEDEGGDEGQSDLDSRHERQPTRRLPRLPLNRIHSSSSAAAASPSSASASGEGASSTLAAGALAAGAASATGAPGPGAAGACPAVGPAGRRGSSAARRLANTAPSA